MQLHLVFVGKTAFPDMDSGIQRYLDRLRHYIPTELHIIKAEKIHRKSAGGTIREREGERILKLVEKQGYLIVWDQRGRQFDSLGFARFMERIAHEGVSKVWMVVGGPSGLSPAVLKEANAVISLSEMTFPHDLARLVIVEQLYRAYTILKGEPYHK